MISRHHFPRLLAAVIIALAATVAAKTLNAQATFTNPPCAAIAVVNNNPCGAIINLVTVPANFWPPFNLPSGAGVFLPIPAGAAVRVVGIIPAGGPATPFNPPPPPFVACGPTAWWAVNLPLAPGCRFSACVDPANCSITFF